eukprot:scaffold398534_cov32-Prasinocladus_malaysianus.AAC.1
MRISDYLGAKRPVDQSQAYPVIRRDALSDHTIYGKGKHRTSSSTTRQPTLYGYSYSCEYASSYTIIEK